MPGFGVQLVLSVNERFRDRREAANPGRRAGIEPDLNLSDVFSRERAFHLGWFIGIAAQGLLGSSFGTTHPIGVIHPVAVRASVDGSQRNV